MKFSNTILLVAVIADGVLWPAVYFCPAVGCQPCRMQSNTFRSEQVLALFQGRGLLGQSLAVNRGRRCNENVRRRPLRTLIPLSAAVSDNKTLTAFAVESPGVMGTTITSMREGCRSLLTYNSKEFKYALYCFDRVLQRDMVGPINNSGPWSSQTSAMRCWSAQPCGITSRAGTTIF